MKKKFLKFTGLFITFLMIMWFSGCGNKPEETAETKPEENTNTEASSETVTPEPTQEPEEPQDIETFFLSQGYNGDIIYIIDSEGNKLKTIDRNDIAKNIPEGEKDQYRLNNEETYYRCSLVAEGGGFLFFRDTVPSGDDNKYQYSVFAVREDDCKIYPVAKYPYEYFVFATDYYEDGLFVDYSFGYDENGEYLGAGEKKYIYDDSIDKFIEKDSEYDGVFESARTMNIRLNGTVRVVGQGQDCFTRTMKENGFILGSSDNGYVMVDDRGAATPLVNCPDCYINMYNKGHMIFVNSSYGSGASNVFIYDVDGKAVNQISDDWSMIQTIGLNDNDFYYYAQDEEEYGIKRNHVFKYNAESRKTTLLYEAETIPGVTLQPGVEDFRLFGDKMYAVCYEDGATKWMRIDCGNGKATYTDIDCPVGTIDVFEYGTIAYGSKTETCPDCGTPLTKTYSERFVLDSKYSKNADKINDFLKEAQEAELADQLTGDDEYWTSECEEHQENPSWYLITDDYNVSSVKIISDKYLAVDMGGYWYGGGAHGMPMRFQYLFDLETGEKLDITDFYTGTGEDFKELVAEKTKEDYLSYDSSECPYFASDANVAYNDAYGYVDLERGTIDFAEDGIYFYYPPYEMGPYAAGYIDIFISYQELLGRDNL